jgi:hypothetical protein
MLPEQITWVFLRLSLLEASEQYVNIDLLYCYIATGPECYTLS